MEKQLVTRAELAKIKVAIANSAAALKPIKKISRRVARDANKHWMEADGIVLLDNALSSLDFDAVWCLRQVRAYERTLPKPARQAKK